MAQDDGQLLLAAMVGLGGGLFTFAKGLREFRKYRLVADTPAIRIRSAPMGLVQIRGEARGEETLLSPVARTPCYVFKVDVQEWHSDSEGGHEWKHVATDIQSVKFVLQDASGNVLIDPANAELDLPCSPVREVRSPASSSPASPPIQSAEPVAHAPATEGEILQYVQQARMRHVGQFVGRGIEMIARGADPVHEAQRQAFLSMLTNPTGAGAAGFRSQMVKMMMARKDPTGENTRLALEVWKHPQGSPEFQSALVRFGQAYTRAMSPNMPTPDAATVLMYIRQHPELLGMVASVAAAAEPQADPETEKARQAAQAIASQEIAAMARAHMPSATGHFRLTEYCLRPGQMYDITGTCAENPHPRDEFDRNIIVKGANEPTFLISCKADKELASGLRKRAARMVFGGAALAIVCLAILLGKMGMF